MERTKQNSSNFKAAVKSAFPLTIPVLTGYIFMGAAFGILLASKGFGPLWAATMGIFVYAGSGQFLAVTLLASGASPFIAFLLTLAVNARHIFYGLSLLETFKKFGKIKYYLVFSMTDETFATLQANKPPNGVKTEKFFLAVSILNHVYWIVGCTLGSILGQALPINTTGIDFVMTALFVVIFLEQMKNNKHAKIPAAIGLALTLLCRLLVGSSWFLVAAMPLIVIALALAKKPIERSLAK